MTKPIERAKRPPLASVREAPFKLVRDATVDGEPNDGLTLDGYGAVFNSPAIIDSWEGRFVETIAPGSMKRSFRENPPRIQYDHGRHPLIGSIPIASLRSITEDTDPILAPEGGAHVIGRIFDNWLMQPVRDAIAADPPGISPRRHSARATSPTVMRSCRNLLCRQPAKVSENRPVADTAPAGPPR